jgi:hypothetical protein
MVASKAVVCDKFLNTFSYFSVISLDHLSHLDCDLGRFLFSFFFLRFFLRSDVSDPEELEELEPGKREIFHRYVGTFHPSTPLAGKAAGSNRA